MSYILDALKKSEEERREKEEQQHLAYTPLSVKHSARIRKRLAPAPMLTTILLLSLLILGSGWWYLNRTEVTEEQVSLWTGTTEKKQRVTVEKSEVPPQPNLADKSAKQAVEPVTASTPTPAMSTPMPENEAQQPDQAMDQPTEAALRPSLAATSEPENAPQPPDQTTDQPAEVELRPAPGTALEPDSLPLLADLPFSTRSMLPELKLRGHVYSEAPSQRMIMINTSIAREGDAVAPDLSLVEITENGLILSFRNTLFRIEMF